MELKSTKKQSKSLSRTVANSGVQLIPEILDVFIGKARYRAAYGGRGSGKSYTFATMLLIRAMSQPMKVLCARELQVSIKDSVHAQLSSIIDRYDFLKEFYRVTRTEITGKNGTVIIFKGLRHNAAEIKSMADIKICWVEEAEAVSQLSWDILRPTIRMDDSEIWVTWNPMLKGSPTDKLLRQNRPENAKVVKVNYDSNKWFSHSLEMERLFDLERRPEQYAWIWLGEYATVTDAQIFKGKYAVEEIPYNLSVASGNKKLTYYYGVDWGFSTDPTVIIKCFFADDMKTLYIVDEVVGQHTELDNLPELFSRIVPNKQQVVWADNSRPETISHMVRRGWNVCAAPKWSGSIEDGIEFLRGFKIIIAPHCEHTIKEFELYSYATDRLTGEPTTNILDANNHAIDALRYALVDFIKGNGTALLLQTFEANYKRPGLYH